MMSEITLEPSNAPLRRLMGVRIVGTGSYVPDVVVRNADLAALGYDADWIVQRTGIEERRHAPPDQATGDLALIAAERCLAAAEVDRRDVDLLVLGTFSPDQPVPSTACAVQHRLGINAPAMDLQAACAGFIYALATGMQFVATGCSQRALVIGADCNSRIVDPTDMKTYPLFGDGAGAVLLAPGDSDQGMLAYTLGSDGAGADLLCTRMGGSRMPSTAEGLQGRMQFMRMEGKPVFKWAVRLVQDSVRAVLGHAGLQLSDIDLFVPHQANVRIVDAAAEGLGFPRDRVVVNLDRYGNTSAGSIPLALDEAVRAGRVRRGSRVLLCGFGGGLTWGTGIWQW